MNNPAACVRIFLVLLGLLGTPVLAACQETSAEILTLDQAIGLAVRDNRTMKNSRLEVGKVEDRVAATRTLRLPAFNLYALGAQQLAPLRFEFEKGVFGTFPGVGPIPNQNTFISTARVPTAFIVGRVTQPISQQYRLHLSLNLLELNKEVAGEELRRQQQSIVNDVKQLYYGMLQSQSALKSLQESIGLYRELDRVTGEYVSQQVALKSENLEVKTRLARAEYEELNVSNQLASQREQLNNLLGRDIRMKFEVNPVLEPGGFETDLLAAQNRALDQRPEVREARLKVKQAELDRRIKKSELIPDVSLGFNYISPRNFDEFVPRTVMNVGIVLSWDVFDWGRKRSEIAEKRKTSEQTENALLETESKVLIDVNSKFRKLQQTNQLVRVARLAQETARESLRLAENKYRVQAVLLSDVLRTQSSVAEADHQYRQALLAFWTAKAELEKTLGEDK
jgi:outer membrane protein